jgi:thiol:disulfide interchange protein
LFKHPPASGIYTPVKRTLAACLLMFAVLFTSTVNAAHTRAMLLLSVSAAKPGDTVLAAVRLQMDSGWHTYWHNGGDSGGPTRIEWQLPAGITAGEIQWPVPEKFTLEGLVTYVYHGEVVLIVPLKLANDVKPGPLELKANISWLECEKVCVPGDQTVSATLTIASTSQPSTDAAFIESAKAKLPGSSNTLNARAAWEKPADEKTRKAILEWNISNKADSADFFPYANETFEVSATSENLPTTPDQVKLRVTVRKIEGDWPKEINGLLISKSGEQLRAFEAKIPLATSATAPTTTVTTSAGGLLLNLLLALIGGMILNLMPCVLPILCLKILGVVNQQGQAAKIARQHSLTYAAGVLVSFWIIAALVVLGRLATWGEQFQDARFIVIVTALMTLVSLNLFGVFEFVLPGRATGTAAELSARDGAAGAFFNGILAVVLGASCVAPVLAAAIGWAVNQPPLIIVLSFTFIGIGLALPYVTLTFFPTLQRLLPRPGAWMEKFKMALGFPMLATAAWLLSLVTDHYGSSGILWVGLFLVLLATAAWIFGEFIQRGSKGKALALVCALGCLGLGYGYGLEHKLDWRHPNYAALAGTASALPEGGIEWQPWSAEAVAQARTKGRPVLVDFTANWCLTCQANKASSIQIDSVRQKLKEINAVTLLGDYTRKSPDIRDELKRFERAGVPLVLVYPRDSTAPPEILPTLLTPGIMLEALEKAAK